MVPTVGLVQHDVMFTYTMFGGVSLVQLNKFINQLLQRISLSHFIIKCFTVSVLLRSKAI